jgi:hypothetical protein
LAKDDGKILSVKFNKAALEKKVVMKEKAVERKIGSIGASLEERLSKIDMDALEKDIKQRPMTYLAVAFTAGVAIGAMIGGARKRD